MYSTAPNMCITRMPVGAGNPFTVISNDVASYSRDDRLSSSAKGILLTIFALPDKSWHFSVKGLSLLMKDSEDKIRSTLKELKKLGYYVAEKNKDEKGRYRSTRYCFYETAQFHTDEDAGKENGLFSSPCPHRAFPDVDNPDTVFPAQLNTNQSNTNPLSTKSVCQSGAETTDGRTETENVFNSKENHSDAVQQVTEIKELEIMFAEATGFAEEVKQYLAEMISTGRINSKKTVDAEELLQKLWTVYTENGLPVFLKSLEAECTKSLKKLKYVKARDSYLKSVIAEFTLKYTSQNSADKKDKPKKERSETEHSESVKVLGFREMLKEMHYPGYNLDSEIFDSEENYYSYFGDYDDDLKDCIIPDSFMDNQETMENALKFLGRYHCIDSDEYRTFADETFRSLARIICTSKAGRKTVSGSRLIHRLNEIHADKYDIDDSIFEFVQSFRTHSENKSAEYSDVTNKKAYKEAMLVSFLDGEYQEMNLTVQHKIAMMDKHLAEAEEKRRKEKEQHEEWVNWMKENNFDLPAEETSAEPETAVEESKQIVLAVEESIPQESADTVADTAETAPEAEETTEPKEKWTKAHAEQVVRNLFGEDISEERLNYFTKGTYDEEPDTLETEEVIPVAEDTTAPEAEKTESVCPADRHEHQKSDSVSEDGTFTVTDEMRNRVQNALYGENKEEICRFTEDTTVPEMEEPVEKRKSVSLPATFRCTARYRSIWFPDYA